MLAGDYCCSCSICQGERAQGTRERRSAREAENVPVCPEDMAKLASLFTGGHRPLESQKHNFKNSPEAFRSVESPKKPQAPWSFDQDENSSPWETGAPCLRGGPRVEPTFSARHLESDPGGGL